MNKRYKLQRLGKEIKWNNFLVAKKKKYIMKCTVFMSIAYYEYEF